MKLRNKKTGEICELGHIRQAWREEKDGGMGYMFLKANDNNGIIYNSIAEMMNEWEDYKPKEPLIKDKDEEARKAIRVFSEAIHEKKILVAKQFGRGSAEFSCGARFWIKLPLSCETMDALEDGAYYAIDELCGDKE